MRLREGLEPVRMQRVALVAPQARLRSVLVEVADAGHVEIDRRSSEVGPEADTEAGRLLRARQAGGPPRLSREEPDLERLVEDDRLEIVAGEAQLQSFAAQAVVRDGVAALAGWTPAADVARLAERLAGLGGAVVPLASPRGVDPPTLMRPEGVVRQSFAPLVRTYTTVPYVDLDPTLLAGVAYVLMFGVMFGDAGHGALLLVGGLLLLWGRGRLARLHRLWPFVVGAAGVAMLMGLLYGEFFGPTGVLPVLWLSPLEDPLTLLAAALGMGAVLLGGAYVVGTINRWREGRWPLALVAPSGIAGFAVFAGLGLVLLGLGSGLTWLQVVGGTIAAGGLALSFVGFVAAAGGGAAGFTQATVELLDSVIRLGTNVVSFSRLAAFGLTHAALTSVVWDATTALAGGTFGWAAAVLVFVVGNALAFSLEALVAGIQALRLEYYELFSRVFATEGRPFRPWHLPVAEDVPVPGPLPAAERTP